MLSLLQRLLTNNLCFFPRCHSFYSKRYSRALYLGAKAIQLNSNSVQALLLKGAALRNMGRVQEAIIHFREAIRLAPCRLDCYEGETGTCQCGSRPDVCTELGDSVRSELAVSVMY